MNEEFFNLILILDVDECVTDLCKNGATCADLVGSYRCDCPAGYTGSNCETSIEKLNFCICNLKIGEWF